MWIRSLRILHSKYLYVQKEFSVMCVFCFRNVESITRVPPRVYMLTTLGIASFSCEIFLQRFFKNS